MKDIKDFSEWDYKILEFVNENEPVKIEQIKEKFKTLSAIQDRVEQLSEPKHSELGFFISNTSVMIPVWVDNNIVYKITDFGKITLQDYKINRKNYNKKVWLENAWIPILVTIGTNLLVIGIKVLWPLILELFANF